MSTQKFRFYVTDLHNGCIVGTNNAQDAHDLSACEDYFVVDTETGMWLTSDGSEEQVQELARSRSA